MYKDLEEANNTATNDTPIIHNRSNPGKRKLFARLNNMQQRILAGGLGISLVLASLLNGTWTFFAFFSALCFFTIFEYIRKLQHDWTPVFAVSVMVVAMAMFVISFLVAANIVPNRYIFIIVALAFLLFIVKLFNGGSASPFNDLAGALMALFYIVLPFSLVNFLAFFKNETYDWQIPLGLFILVWASDTGAFFTGRIFGRRKLFERISPKKTWEGLAGGSVFAMMASAYLAFYFPILTATQWYGLGIIVTVFGTLGDLVESMLKRSRQLKDSGSLIPGHGGLLDRFDSFLFAVPATACYLLIV